MILTEENYFSKEANMMYSGSSQIKSFMECEARTMAELNGEYVRDVSDALLASSYIDEAITGDLEKFKQEHPEMFTKSGELYSKYKHLDSIVEQAKNDAMFWKYLNGEHQKIFTGEINGVKIKIKTDSYFKDKVIVDLKAIKNFDLSWNDKSRQKENFIDLYDYILQASLYREIVKQNDGVELPFIIAALTKETASERALLKIPEELMDTKLEFLKSYLPYIQQIKDGKIEPKHCGRCEYCRSKAKTVKIYNYTDFFEIREGLKIVGGI